MLNKRLKDSAKRVNMNYKVIACDLDGTLLDSRMQVSEGNKAAIKYLTEKGLLFVPTTGRALSEMREVVENPDIRYIIYSNGSGILDKKTGKHVFMGISKETISFMSEAAKRYRTYPVAHYNGGTYVPKVSKPELRACNVCPSVAELVQKYATQEDDFYKMLSSVEELESICFFFADDNDKEQLKNILMQNENLYVVEGWEHNLEVFSTAAGKDKALKRLAKILNITMKEIISIGDSDNDSAMTKAAGLGLAAGNACEKLKGLADEIICSNDEDVVKYVATRYFGMKEL